MSEIDERIKAYLEGFKKGNKHSTMSEETSNCINKIKRQVDSTKKDIESINEKLEEVPTEDGMKLANKEMIEEVFKQADKKYASQKNFQLVSGIVFSGVGAVLLWAVNQVLNLI